MEEKIEDYLEEYYKNIKINVKTKEFRYYVIELEIENSIAEVNFTYDNHFTFEMNMNSLINFMNSCILEYYKR